MLKQDIKFTDYNNNERTITEYFHLNEAEIVELQAKSVNGIQAEMQDAILSNDAGRVLDFIKMLVHKSYGKKSLDGLNFEKSPEILQKFITSAYYSDFLLGLIEDNGLKGQEFVQGIMPAKLVERALAQVQGENGGEPDRTVYGQSAREQFAAAQAAKQPATPDMKSPYPAGSFGQPSYPQVQQQETQETARKTMSDLSAEEKARFDQWLAQKEAEEATRSAAAPSSPDTFRVREDEPNSSLSRPPHEQMGDAQ